MYSSTKNITEAEAVKPNFVLSLLAACSSAIPAVGKQGEATLSKQLSELLTDKTMAVEELNLTYAYKFGFNIVDALKFIGFDGNFEDFAVKQKCFAMHGSCISLTPLDMPIQEESPAVDKLTAHQDGPEDRSQESTDEGESDASSDVDVTGWHDVANRLFTGLVEDGCFEDDEDVDTNSPKDSSDEGESDAESDVDIDGRYDVANGVGTALVGDDSDAWQVLGSRVAIALNDNHDEESADADAWRDVSCRLATALDDNLDEKSADADAWRDVSCRFTAAFKLSHDDDCCVDPSPLHHNHDEEVVDTDAWRQVSCRFAAAFKRFSNDDEECPSPDVSEWGAVGVNVLRCLEDSGEF